MKNHIDGGEAILESFRNLGIDYVMSSPGSEWGPVWEALARQAAEGRDGPTYLGCWHETLAVNLAVGYTAVTGRMQAVLLHAGAGLLQGSLGIRGALFLGTPMVVLSSESLSFGEVPERDAGSHWLASLSVVGGPDRLMEPMVKWSDHVRGPEVLYQTVVRAGELAQRTPSGPIYLDVPIDTMLHDWTPPAKMRPAPAVSKPRAADADIERVAKLLVDSKNPVIATEAAGRDIDAFEALVGLAESLAIPVVETGVPLYANFPKDHPLHQGFSMRPFLQDADLVLAVRNPMPWYPSSSYPPKATVVVIDESPHRDQMVYQNLKADLYLEGDSAAAMRLLTQAIGAARVDGAAVDRRRERLAAAHAKRREECRAAEAGARTKRPIDVAWVCATMREALPKNAIVVDETTTQKQGIQRHMHWNLPQSYFRVPTGLGQGLGMALGVKLARPDRPVVATFGDGGFLYNPVVQGLGLAAEAKLPILIVIFNNKGYLGMKRSHLDSYPDGAAAEKDLFYGATINGFDYAQLAGPIGGYGRRVVDPEELPEAFGEALAAVSDGRFAILNIEIKD